MSMNLEQNQPMRKKEPPTQSMQSWQQVADFARLKISEEEEVQVLEEELNGLFLYEPETAVLVQAEERQGLMLSQWRADRATDVGGADGLLSSTHCREDGFFAVPLAVEAHS